MSDSAGLLPPHFEKSRPVGGVRMVFDERVPMRDGVTLSADIYLPATAPPYSAVLLRTPYDNSAPRYVEWARRFVQGGYAFVVQDCRGRYDSGGDFYAWHNEAKDGFDTQEWLGAQTWCNGRIGTVGASYDGATQWQSAPLRSKYLRAMATQMTPSDFWFEDEYVGGAFALALNVHWAVSTSAHSNQQADVYDWPRLFRGRPLRDLDLHAGRHIDFYHDWVDHDSYDDYWRQISNRNKYGEMDVPVLHIAGWYDAYAGAAFRDFNGMREGARSEAARANQRIIVGPWAHGSSGVTKVGEIEFGREAWVDFVVEQLRWFEVWLDGETSELLDEPPIRIWVMGENRWRGEHEWPLARTVFTPYYLHSSGDAGDVTAGGGLTPRSPGAEPPDAYTYDPANPVPTIGGNHSMFGWVVPVGPWDQRAIEARQDVLTYTSEPLPGRLEVTGPVSAILYASSTAPDTDFTARLVDVDPDGTAINLCEGIIRARFRDSWSEPSLLTPGQVYALSIDMEVTSNVFAAGHCVRLDVSSSNFPRVDANPNTGRTNGSEAEVAVAGQRIFHDTAHPSHVLLPVVPSVTGSKLS